MKKLGMQDEPSVTTLSRRTMLLTPVALTAMRALFAAAGKKMTLAIHQNTSAGSGYRKSLEGWSRARIKYVEITNVLLDEFLKTDDLPSARRVLTDLGMTLVRAATGVTGLWEPNPNRAASLENLKRRYEMIASMGLDRVRSFTTSLRADTKTSPCLIFRKPLSTCPRSDCVWLQDRTIGSLRISQRATGAVRL